MTFVEHLDRASRIVRTWPKWKQEILGGTASDFVGEKNMSDAKIPDNPEEEYVLRDLEEEYEEIQWKMRKIEGQIAWLKQKKFPGLTASEALFGFAGWLCRRDQKIIASAHHDAACWAEAVGEFCEANNLTEPRNGWEKNIVHPSGEKT